MKKEIFAFVALATGALALNAQSFDNGEVSYTNITTYDSWADSPFRNGTLAPNAGIVDNPYKNGYNATEKCAAYQRSRHASNMYGIRIDLAEPFELGKTAQYIHALMHRPTDGRVMCIGLGRKRTVEHQAGRDVEQFRVVSTTEVAQDEWSDAVFCVRGAGDIDIHALVFVTDLESPHNYAEDHIAYVDEIEINASSQPRINVGNYPLNFNANEADSRSDRQLNAITFACAQSGSQTVTFKNSGYMYSFQPSDIMHAKPGEQIQPSINFTGSWMNVYVYIDKDNDGGFEVAEDIGPNNRTPECDLVAYSAARNDEAMYNMNGVITSGNTVSMGAFTIPAGMAPGLYRVRVKTDYMSLDPAGRMDNANNITDNGGNILDFMIDIHADDCVLNQSGLNGELKIMNGSTAESINDTSVPFGQAITIYQEAAPGFVPGPITVRYGYDLDGPQTVKDNPRWYEATIPASATDANGKVTIPAAYIFGNIRLESNFVEGSGDTSDKGDYPLNFDPDALMNTQSDRAVYAITVTGDQNGAYNLSGWSTTVPFPVYADATSQICTFNPEETINVNPTAVAKRWLYGYVYLDIDDNGYFDLDRNELIITKAGNSESGYANMPNYQLPADMAPGFYRMRFKSDWKCDDPGGRYGSAYTDQFINSNRGQIIDFTLRIANLAAIDGVAADADGIDIAAGHRCIIIKTASPQHAYISTLGGQMIFNGMIEGRREICVLPGVYIVCGTKLAVN